MEKHLVDEHKEGNFVIKIYQDDNAFSPREDDNLGTMICFHGRYNLGDKHDYNHNDYSSWHEQKKAIQKDKTCVLLPLYLYDHGGITISTKPFSCQWDSGQVGWIAVSKDKVRKEFGVKYITWKIKDKVKQILEDEVKTYDQYLTGDVYGYVINEVSVCDKGCEHEEHVDSCWGFYGQDVCLEEARGILDHYIERQGESIVS